MNTIHQQRLLYIIILMTGLAIGAGLILFALRQNINAFLTPTELVNSSIIDHPVRLGGMVKQGSVSRKPDDLGVEFLVTDFKQAVRVYYQGILPDLFREGKGVVVEGRLTAQGKFIASQVLAKHDENYRPPSASTTRAN